MEEELRGFTRCEIEDTVVEDGSCFSIDLSTGAEELGVVERWDGDDGPGFVVGAPCCLASGVEVV